jgi:hypothetical protein
MMNANYMFIEEVIFLKVQELKFKLEEISADFLRILRNSAGNNLKRFVSQRLTQNTQKIRRNSCGIE